MEEAYTLCRASFACILLTASTCNLWLAELDREAVCQQLIHVIMYLLFIGRCVFFKSW